MSKIWTDDKKQLILEMRNAGKQYQEIAEHFGITKEALSAVVTRMTKEGYDVIKAKPWTEEEELELLELREAGETNLNIATILGKTIHSVKTRSSLLVKQGLLDRRGSGVKTDSKYSKEELIGYIKQYVSSHSAPSSIRHKVVKYFGSWTEGLKAAGISGNIGGKFDPDKPTTLYFLDFGTHKKIGITQRTIQQRFSGAPSYTVLDSLTTDFDNAFYLEKELKRGLVQYIPEDPWFERNGKTECFQSDCTTLEELL